MKSSRTYVIIAVAFMLIGVGCTVSFKPQQEGVDYDPVVPAAEENEMEVVSSTDEVVEQEEAKEEIDPRIKPVIGGTERDEYGAREECIINGDCKSGYMCIQGVCNEPQ